MSKISTILQTSIHNEILNQVERVDPDIADLVVAEHIFALFQESRSCDDFLGKMKAEEYNDGTMTNFYRGLYNTIANMINPEPKKTQSRSSYRSKSPRRDSHRDSYRDSYRRRSPSPPRKRESDTKSQPQPYRPHKSSVSAKTRHHMTDMEKWEEEQLIHAGVLSRAEVMEMRKAKQKADQNDENDPMYAKFRDRGRDSDSGQSDDDMGVLADAEEDVEDVDIELNPNEPKFLVGRSARTQDLAPLRIQQAPEGSMARAAERFGSELKKKREALLEQQNELLDSIPKGLDKAWVDPVPDANERLLAAELRGIGMLALSGMGGAGGTRMAGEMPEWKKKSLGTNPTFGMKRTQLTIKQQREALPVFRYRDQIIQAMSDHQMMVVVGETGSGKTTQIPQYLAEAGFCSTGRIGVTQPRRVAASSVSKRVSEEFGCRLGQEIGYAVRFEDLTSPQTIIKYMTDGLLLRECLLDRNLSAYSVIMLDEAHERTIATDILFGLCKDACTRRKGGDNELKLIVTSATLEEEKFSKYFNECPILRIPGKSYPVEKMYANEPMEDYLAAALDTAMEIHIREEPGDILIFLTGQEEIDMGCEILYDRMKRLGDETPELIILPIYSALPSEIQTKVFEPAPPGCRKCIIATNIAEASLTIDGIKFVIDPGFVKQNAFNPRLGMDSLQVVPISRASATQRAGRAGRTAPGKCYRLYTESAYKNEMLPSTVPEIQRANLGNSVLLLKAMGINDIDAFDFMDRPPPQTLLSALESLYALNALDDEGLLTRVGRKMAEFPLEPPLSKMLLMSAELGCSEEIVTITAMLSVENVFFRPKDKQIEADGKKTQFMRPEGDHLTYLFIYEKWKKENYSSTWCARNFIQTRAMRRAQDIRQHLVSILDKYKLPLTSCGKNYDLVLKAIVSGFFNHAAKRDPTEGYRTLVENQTCFIHPSSATFQKNEDWVIYHEITVTTKEYMRHVSVINPRWLVEFAPNFYVKTDPKTISKQKAQIRLEPLYSKYQEPDDWRISKAKRRKN
ncbi:putative ATP-dependent RNA helicase dhx8 [Blattamonas nauphoetae]|uniref:RNA helicase n=1 Tax=Blattamonas nauphoetae TaxID=2049346 RepID=A0ABQ9X6F4_9EUKA|nr:putative ATP-dependent RNA helicase dhx8 [Blattamonas nauphoetae]